MHFCLLMVLFVVNLCLNYGSIAGALFAIRTEDSVLTKRCSLDALYHDAYTALSSGLLILHLHGSN